MTDVQIHDMLKFSNKYDVKALDERYKELLSLDLHRKSKNFLLSLTYLALNDYLKYIFKKRAHAFSNNL